MYCCYPVCYRVCKFIIKLHTCTRFLKIYTLLVNILLVFISSFMTPTVFEMKVIYTETCSDNVAAQETGIGKKK